MNKDYKAVLVDHLEKELRSFESRQGVHAATGFSPRYLANLDMTNSGIGGRIRIGRKIFYPREEIIKWVSERTTTEGKIVL